MHAGFALAGENLDHAAHGVRAVLSRARALDDVDMIDQGDRQVLKVGGPSRERTHSNAIDQHERLAAAHSPHRNGRQLPGSTLIDQVEACAIFEQG